MKGHSLYKDR